MRREEAEAIYDAGREAVVEALVAPWGEIEELTGMVTALRGEVDELRRQLNRGSSNSSMPPSQDPPKSRAERRAAAREAYKRSMRGSGGQPGHKGKAREMAAPERVDERFDHLPGVCECGHCFTGFEERLGDPVIHQKWELPPIVPIVYEHLLWRLGCPRCGKASLAELRSAGVSSSAFGPRMEAHIAMLAGVYRLSRRQVADIVREVFGCPISTGALDATIMRISAILADPWAELREAVRRSEVIHADETTWRLAGAQQWIWLAASSLVACYRIDPTRTQRAAKELIGEDFGGFVVTDRYAGYHFLDVLQQQLCWCHAIRQLVELSERDGAPGKLGSKLVKAAREVIAAHRVYLEQRHELSWLAAQLAPLRERIRTLLEQGTRGQHVKTANFCTGLLDEYEALWTFCEVPAIEPTNNVAERAVRHAVMMRKTQLGTQSDAGSRWIERICSVRETSRLQGRSALAYLIEAAEAAHQRRPVPSLAPP
ncbi:MAG: IS66 family transposase [Actinobacteria bacterium]|nr:IS66 family transposase [Actinomycetota bacterium]